MANPPTEPLTIAELAQRAGVTPRTIRYYLSEGLLPPPEGAGPNRVYTPEHLLRLEAIKCLKAMFLPLDEIRRRLSGLGPAELQRLVEAPRPATGSALEYVRAALSQLPPATPPAPPQPAAPIIPAPHLASDPGFVHHPPSAQPTFHAQLNVGRFVPSELPGVPGRLSVTPPNESVWHRVQLASGVELQYQDSDDPERQARLRQLIDLARRLFGPTA
jgi:DNA-binding transcriptional MerR regulator